MYWEPQYSKYDDYVSFDTALTLTVCGQDNEIKSYLYLTIIGCPIMDSLIHQAQSTTQY